MSWPADVWEHIKAFLKKKAKLTKLGVAVVFGLMMTAQKDSVMFLPFMFVTLLFALGIYAVEQKGAREILRVWLKGKK